MYSSMLVLRAPSCMVHRAGCAQHHAAQAAGHATRAFASAAQPGKQPPGSQGPTPSSHQPSSSQTSEESKPHASKDQPHAAHPSQPSSAPVRGSQTHVTQLVTHVIQHVNRGMSAALTRVAELRQQLQQASSRAATGAIKVEATVVQLQGQGTAQEVASATAPTPAPTSSTFIPPQMWERLHTVSRMVNEATGYTSVERLKRAVVDADEALITARHIAVHRKTAYEDVLSEQMRLQRDLNSLLQRKNTWTDADVQRFTELYRGEHKLDAEVSTAREAAETAASDVELRQADLMKAIRERYTEEQLWGDKIRRAATWYTWGLMALQLLSFVGVIMFIEPRRVRLLKEHVSDLLESHEGRTHEQVREELSSHVARVEELLAQHEVNVVMHNPLDEQGVHTGGAGLVHHQAGSSVEAQHKVDLPKLLEAVVQFMDGMHVELVANRAQVAALTQQVAHIRQQVAALSTAQGGHAAALHDNGSALLAPAPAPAPAVPQADEGHLGEVHDLPQEGGSGIGKAAHAQGVLARINSWAQGLSKEEAVGVAAAVAAGAGAVAGVALAAWFTSSGR